MEEIEGNIPETIYKYYYDSYTIGTGMWFYSHTFKKVEGEIKIGVVTSTKYNWTLHCVIFQDPTEGIKCESLGSQPSISCNCNTYDGTVTIYRNHDYDDIPNSTTFRLYVYYK